MLEKNATTQVPIHDLIAKRWSPCAFDANKPLNHEQIVSLLEAARWAPSCYGAQPWRFILFNKSTHANAWDAAFSCLVEANQIWVKNAPVLILTTARNLFERSEKPNRFAQYDCGAACENICLQAISLGLVAHQMAGFNADKARALFNIPSDFTCLTMIAIGYQASPEMLDANNKERDLAPRVRKPLEEICFENEWGSILS